MPRFIARILQLSSSACFSHTFPYTSEGGKMRYFHSYKHNKVGYSIVNTIILAFIVVFSVVFYANMNYSLGLKGHNNDDGFGNNVSNSNNIVQALNAPFGRVSSYFPANLDNLYRSYRADRDSLTDNMAGNGNGNSDGNAINKDLPQASSDGQFIDHIFKFKPPYTNYIFDFNLTKNHLYKFTFVVYTANISIKLFAFMTGPDANEDNNIDNFTLANGKLFDLRSVGTFEFTAAETGNYTLNLTGFVSMNVNLYFKVTDESLVYLKDAILLDTAGFKNGKLRQYFFDLDDDKVYEFMVCRGNSFAISGSFASVTYNLYDPEQDIYPLVYESNLSIPLKYTSQSLGTALKGTYRLDIYIETNVPDVNIVILVREEEIVGDGPEDNPVEIPQNNDTTNSSIIYHFSIPAYVIPVGIAIGVSIILASIYINKSNFKKIKR
ncbi:MAG: hypothetical protein ACTSU2_03155 [Promethearchaeota archaeon]